MNCGKQTQLLWGYQLLMILHCKCRWSTPWSKNDRLLERKDERKI